MNYSLVVENSSEYTVSSEFSEVFATLEGNGKLLIRSWYDLPPYNSLKGAVRFLILNTEEDIEVYPGPTGFWQSLGFTLADKTNNKWQFRR